MNGLYIVFQIEFLSGSKKYRCIFQVNKENMDVAEIMFIELIEVSLRESNLKEIKILTEQYQTIDSNNYKSDRYFIMVDQYVKNRNQVLVGAKILGAGYKPQNLGFSYKITYKTEDSKIMEVEVYIETFSQKYSQTYIKYLDFESGFAVAQVPTADLDKYAKSIAEKASIVLIPDQYTIQSIEAKNFFNGCLFKIVITFNGADYEALIYLEEHTGLINLISWTLKISGDGCETKSDDKLTCVKCSTGFIASADNKVCLREIAGCQTYGDDKLTCSVCKTSFDKVNSICTRDCGTLCSVVSFPWLINIVLFLEFINNIAYNTVIDIIHLMMGRQKL